jgi:hypothetical protein
MSKKTLTQDIKEHFDGTTRTQYLLRTVKKVLGIPVSAYLTRDLYLCVCSCAKRDITILTKKLEDNDELGEQIYETLKSVKYNKKYDTFYETTKDEMETAVFGDEFLDLEICAVCREDTSSRTPCEHPLCVLCENMLKSSTCPICREPLFDEEVV